MHNTKNHNNQKQNRYMKETIINYSLLKQRVEEYSIKVGRASARPIITLYYVLRSSETSRKDKLIIWSALAYLVFPQLDILDAKRLPFPFGILDEITAITAAYQRTCSNLSFKVHQKIESTMNRLFGPEFATYELTK